MTWDLQCTKQLAVAPQSAHPRTVHPTNGSKRVAGENKRVRRAMARYDSCGGGAERPRLVSVSRR